MADTPKKRDADQAIVFDCCSGGTLRIHKDLFKQMQDGVIQKNIMAAGPDAGFLKFSLQPTKGVVLKPTLTKQGSGKDTTFVVTIDLGPGDGKEC